MIALVLSTDSGKGLPEGEEPGRKVLAFLPASLSLSDSCSSRGLRSLIVRQAMHRNFSNSLGTLTLLSQHIHFLEIFSSSFAFPFFPLITLVGVDD
jgi:hypothetical protein